MRNTFSLLSSVVLALIPVTALAQNTNISVQESSNSAVVVGSGNSVNQRNNQNNIQHNFGSTPSAQQSIQQSHNEAAAIGNNNTIHQNSQQQNIQQRLDVNGYYNHPYFRR